MNTENPTAPLPDVITLEDIRQKKNEKKAQIDESKERMMKITQDLFVPVKPQNGFDGIMQNINAGIAAYDGLMTGIKIFKRVRTFFAFTRRKKKL